MKDSDKVQKHKRREKLLTTIKQEASNITKELSLSPVKRFSSVKYTPSVEKRGSSLGIFISTKKSENSREISMENSFT